MLLEELEYSSKYLETLSRSIKYLSHLFEENSDTYNEYISKNNNREIYESSEKLGKSGWAAPCCLDNQFFKNDCDAVKFAKTDLSKFEKECLERKLVNTIIQEIDKLNYLNNNVYYKKAKKYMNVEDYFAVALSLMPLLENIVKKMIVCDNKRLKNKEKYREEMFKKLYNKIFNSEIKGRFSKDLFILNVFPSLYSYMNLLFCCTDEEWKKDNIFKRDLLMHGRLRHDIIKEIDCIRLFNAVYVASYTVTMLKLDCNKC